ncbi:indole-3-glycerol phosphate synthase TrpC [Peribacillus psychrosaccharolyticus]|uniref:indole-3-glycerol phosphate synthase TrpC n=1 Tax=Peribacillus psychrosaccharolyticus TaxID=1407 RepID=UPI003D2E27C9
MVDFLTKILDAKKEEVKELKRNPSHIQEPARKVSSLVEVLTSSSKMQVIAEIKRASPSKGEIKLEVDPAQQATKYEEAGAAAISVLTDTAYFKGSTEDLALVSRSVKLPLLCKDFIIDQIQIDIAKKAGAQVILLIVAALTQEKLENLYHYAKLQNLEVLVEVHNEQELNQAMLLHPELIGVNNRNLKTFEIDLEVTDRLGAILKKADQLFISESGIKTPADVLRVKKAGAKGILVGETLMKSTDVAQSLAAFQL